MFPMALYVHLPKLCINTCINRAVQLVAHELLSSPEGLSCSPQAPGLGTISLITLLLLPLPQPLGSFFLLQLLCPVWQCSVVKGPYNRRSHGMGPLHGVCRGTGTLTRNIWWVSTWWAGFPRSAVWHDIQWMTCSLAATQRLDSPAIRHILLYVIKYRNLVLYI